MNDRQPTGIRKKQIARAAQRIIAQQGLAKFTTSAIAREVGISEGAMFRHVKNKEDIVMLVIEDLEQTLFMDFPPADEDPLKRLGVFVETRIAMLSDAPFSLQLFFSDQLMQASGAEGVRRIREMEFRSLTFVRECMQEAAQKGLLKEGLYVPHALLIVFGAIMAAVSLQQHQGVDLLKEIQQKKHDLWQTIEDLIRR